METPNASSTPDQYDCASNPGNHGISFEKDLSFVAFVAASLEECTFKLAAEMKDAEKFDDVVLFNEETKEVFLFQAKHVEKGGHISFDDLFSTDPKKSNFAFSKYLQSYLKIREYAVFASYKPTVFIFTNKSLGETEKLTKWLSVRTQNVDSMIRWCDSTKYLCFEPLNDEAISAIVNIMNSELLAMREDIENLSKTGKVSDLLVQYKAPLQNIMQISNGIVSFKEPTVNSIDFATHRWLLSEFKLEPNERLSISSIDDRTVKNLNSFFTGNSRNKQPSVPRVVTEKDTQEFFKSLIFSVEQPTDLRSVAEDLISAWLQRWVGSNDLGQFGKDQAKIFQSYFDEVFDKWHKNTRTPKDFLKFEIEGSACIQRIKTELKKKLLKKNSSNTVNTPMYVRRTIMIPKIKDEEDEQQSQNITSNDGHNLNSSQKSSNSNYNSFDRKSNIQTLHVSDKEFMEQLNKITAETKCQVLIAEPGMGKTTLISHLYSQLEESHNVDVYLIRLKNLKVFQERVSDLHIFQHELSQESRNILLRDLENKTNRILFLLDGFDEMNQSYCNSFVEAIENLLKNQNTQCIITGRNHVRKLLEDKFKVLALKLKPFDHNEQVTFLELFWKINKPDKPLFDKFSNQLLEKFHSEINANDYDFTGLPLMIRMLAEVYADDFEQFLRSEFFEFSESLNVLVLYEKFVKISFNIGMKKRAKNTSDAYEETDDVIDVDINSSYADFIHVHQLLAIQYLEIIQLDGVLENPLKYPRNLNKIQERVQREEEKSLLLSASSTNQVDFVHLSYAEYFVASFMFDHLDCYNFSWLGIIKQRDVVKKFFLLMVENKCKDESRQIRILQSLYGQESAFVVWACLGGNEKVATKLLRSSGIRASDPNHRILLHAAAAGGSTNLVRVLLDEFRFCVNIKLENTIHDFVAVGDSAIHVATRKNNLNIVKLLINNAADVNAENSSKSTPLNIAAENSNRELVEFLIARNANVNSATHDGWTPLHSAARNGHLEVVKLLIESNVNVESKRTDGWKPLHSAAHNGHLEVVTLLIERKANFNSKTTNEWTPLRLAVGSGHLEIVKFLIERGANVNSTSKDEWTPLHVAAEKGHHKIVKLLIDSNADVNCSIYDGWTPLHSAAGCGHVEVVKLLIESNVNVNTTKQDGWKPIHAAALNGHLEVVKFLIERKALFNSKTKDDCTPLRLAAGNGHLKVVKLLIDSNADVICATNDGCTSLYSAAGNGHLEVVKLLIESNVNVNSTKNDGWKPIHAAARNGHLEVVKFLIESKAIFNSKTKDEWTPLGLAVGNGHLEVVKLLIERGVNVNSTTKGEWTPLHVAAENGHDKLVKLLIDSNADVNCANDGWTPLHSAAGSGHVEVVKLLIENNVNVNSTQQAGWKPIHAAALNGHLNVVKFLLERNANANSAINNGCTPFNLAVRNGHLEVAEFLIESNKPE